VTDLKKEQKELYSPPREPVLVDVPPMSFLMIDGQGDPNGVEFMAAIEALYPVAFTLKFSLKAEGLDFTVMPLEALWWADDPSAFLGGRTSEWKWTAMIRQPDEVTAEQVVAAAEQATKKKDLPALANVRLDRLDEGRCAQVMHVGPYDAERPTIEKVFAFIAAQGLQPRGKHHEIYLSDPKRTAPEKLKTVIRQPVG